VENFGWNFSAKPYSEPECTTLSSAALVTAAETVQRRIAVVDFSWVVIDPFSRSSVF
jgi:hypothetical protein